MSGTWLEGHPDDDLKGGWKYYLDEAGQEPAVQAKLDTIREKYRTFRPQDIKVLDPCMGSGHILVYAFDVFVQIYKRAGYNERDAAQSILENNLFGLDIDDRAAQLAYFAVMMKARQYDRRIFTRGIQPHIFSIIESNNINISARWRLGTEQKIADILICDFKDAKEYGSILNISISPDELHALKNRLIEIRDNINHGNLLDMSETMDIYQALMPLCDIAELMLRKYEGVITNPPYMGTKGMNSKLSSYLADNYPNAKSDLFAAFIEKSLYFAGKTGYTSLITQRTWLYISAFEKLRVSIMKHSRSINFVELGAGAFEDLAGEVVQSVSFVLSKLPVATYRSIYVDLTQSENKETDLFSVNRKIADVSAFESAPCHTFAMKLSPTALRNYTQGLVSDVNVPRKGLISSDNNRFLRLWFEVPIGRIQFQMTDISEQDPDKMWVPHNKGGSFRKWYGNQEYVINWANNGSEVKEYAAFLYRSYSRQIMNEQYYFKTSISWSSISAHKIGVRFYPNGFTFDTAGPSMFIGDSISRNLVFGLLASVVSEYYIKATNPTINLLASDIANLPFPAIPESEKKTICELVEKNIEIAKKDWDAFETSWDFKVHPIVQRVNFIKNAENGSSFTLGHLYEHVGQDFARGFSQLKQNEEQLNRVFINIYGLQDELSPEIEDKDVTINQADLGRDIRSLISYAVGCMFGRYSLDTPGLAYAGGDWDSSKYNSFIPDTDNIIPICDDEYFENDIANLFVKWVQVVFGAETLEENLKFIADALGGKGTPREVIRNYFLNGFYADHLKVYQKRPIYWLFDSGKKNGFKALIYIHRYRSDLLACMRTDYVHEQQERYRTQLRHIGDAMGSASASERVRLAKQQKKLQEQALELQKYEEKIHHLADQNIKIDLDDGVVHNYEIFSEVLAKRK